MAVVAVLVAVPVTLLVRGGGDDNAPSARAAPVATPAPELGAGKRDGGLAVGYRVPKGWSETKQASAIRLISDDRAVAIVVAAPASASDAPSVLDDALAAIRNGYQDVKVAPGSGKKVGGLDAKGAVIRAKSGGEEQRILVAVASGKRLAYLVEVFTGAGASADDLRSAQGALNSLDLRG
jgi:hypothetical protein